MANHAPMLTARTATDAHRQRAQRVTLSSSGTAFQGTRPSRSPRRSPCPGRSSAAVCQPRLAASSEKSRHSSLQPPRPWIITNAFSAVSPRIKTGMPSISSRSSFILASIVPSISFRKKRDIFNNAFSLEMSIKCLSFIVPQTPSNRKRNERLSSAWGENSGNVFFSRRKPALFTCHASNESFFIKCRYLLYICRVLIM